LAHARIGKHTIYLHQSGASVISDHSAGDVGDAKVWSDLTPTEIDQLPESAPHRATDLGGFGLVLGRNDLTTCPSNLENPQGAWR